MARRTADEGDMIFVETGSRDICLKFWLKNKTLFSRICQGEIFGIVGCILVQERFEAQTS